MVRTVVNFYFYIHYRISCNYTSCKRFLDTLIDSRNKLSWDSSSNDGVDKFITFSCFIWSDPEKYMTILTMTTCLLNVFFFSFDCFLNCFSVCDLRLTYIGFNLELSLKTINYDIKMEFAHTCDNRLTGFFIASNAECRIFFCKLLKSDAHFFLIGFCLWLDRYIDNRFREFD